MRASVRHDRDALKRAMILAGRDIERAEQLAAMLRDDGWTETAEFAAYMVQGDTLRLRPWENPPCGVDEGDDDPRDATGRKLLRRMLAAGLSRFEPDPLAALAEAPADGRF